MLGAATMSSCSTGTSGNSASGWASTFCPSSKTAAWRSCSPRQITAGPSTEHLAEAGVDVAAASAHGFYLAPDISETMRGFMVASRPDPARFWQALSPLLRQAAKTGQPVRIFGEMVALLWDAGLVDAAIEVEAMWNELGAQYPFSLLCAYPAQPVACAHQLDALTEVCHAHTRVTGAPPEAE